MKFWSEGVASLPKTWGVFVPQELARTELRSTPLGAFAKVSSGVDWLSLRLSFESEGIGVERDELVRSLAEGRKYVRLDDGSFATFDADQGLLVNGFPHKMRGFSMHQDFAGTGTFVPADPALVPTVYNAVKGNSSGYQVAHGGSWGMFMGDVQLATISQTLTTVPGQSYLLSFWINNPVDGFDQEFHAGWNPDGDPADPVYDLVGPGILPWTHLQWVVTASAPRTVLWLAAQNSAYGFGVDDVSVTPIPPVAIRSVARDGDVVVLGWRTAPGLPYQVQFKAALEDADWTDLGAPVIPAGDDATAVDTPDAGDAAGRFYRLVPVP